MAQAMVSLVMVGLDHATAGVALRERLAFADEQVPAALQQLTAPAGPLVEQAAILSTCNRVEVYGVARSPPSAGALAAFLARRHGVPASLLAGRMRVRRDAHAVQHLAETAAGLHSMILGEPQIQGQIRAALEYALAAGTAGPELRRLFEAAIAAGRRVRAETAINRGAVSVPQAAVELAERRAGSLSDRKLLVLGNGTVGTLAARHLVKRRVADLVVLGRDALADGRRLDAALARSEVVISASGAPGPILGAERLRHAAAGGPLLVIDLAVPRDVEPAAAALPGIELHTVDDLRTVAEQALLRRRAELPAAHAILADGVARFTGWLDRRETARPRVQPRM